jgi:DNA-binding HxlR family transcriptional regulator
MDVEAPAPKALRSAGRTLELLIIPLNGLILKALGGKPMRLSELRIRLSGPAQTTLRGHLAKLIELGAVEKGGAGKEHLANENGLTEMGRDLLVVTVILEGWLAESPNGPITLGSEGAKGTVKALAGAWESTMLRGFAARPLSLTQLDRLIAPVTYPALERRLSAMRATGLVEAGGEGSEGTPYAVTSWGARGIGTIFAAARFEHRHMASTTKRLAPIDVETTMMLGVPQAVLAASADGVCSLMAETGRKGRPAGVEVTIDRGAVLSCVAKVEPHPRNWARGSSAGWLDAVVVYDIAKLRMGGDQPLVCGVVLGLHESIAGRNGNGVPPA